eukprot:scaffold80369_cov31-Tisochrysis_lutea.AAC.1
MPSINVSVFVDGAGQGSAVIRDPSGERGQALGNLIYTWFTHGGSRDWDGLRLRVVAESSWLSIVTDKYGDGRRRRGSEGEEAWVREALRGLTTSRSSSPSSGSEVTFRRI